jgi:hypothetical protein
MFHAAKKKENLSVVTHDHYVRVFAVLPVRESNYFSSSNILYSFSLQLTTTKRIQVENTVNNFVTGFPGILYIHYCEYTKKDICCGRQ